MPCVGILGGSFNPPHVGHLALGRTVLDSGLADLVCLVPAASPPHKAVPAEADAETRMKMTQLLAEEDSRLCVDGLELRRQGPSFTIDTLRELSERNPDNTYRLIIGSDLAKTFSSWREYKAILRLAPPLVAERPDDPFSGKGDFPGMLPEEAAALSAGRFPMKPVDVSSTLIRRLFASGADDAELSRYLTPRVLAFIRRMGLYAPAL